MLRVALWPTPTRSTPTVSARLANSVNVDTRPTRWRLTTDVPPDWAAAYDALTSDEGTEAFGLAAAVFISRTRKRTGRGPTFAEMFDVVQALDAALSPPWPDGASKISQRATVQSFRYFVAAHWKRRGWISFERGLERSLRTGRKFRERSNERQRQRVSQSQAQVNLSREI